MEKRALGATGMAVDPHLYIELPVLDSPGTLALARALIERASLPLPTSVTSDIDPLLRRLIQAESELAQAAKRGEASSQRELRQPADLALDTAWTALYERLRAYAILPAELLTEARQAQQLLRTLFPDALAFLRLPYEAEWAQSESRLRTIEQLRLTADVERLAGAEFLAEVRRTHELYGRVLGLPRPREPLPEPELPLDSATLRELRFALARAIARYALRIVAIFEQDGELLQQLLAPLQEVQELRRGGR
jgi:hypothetical protein